MKKITIIIVILLVLGFFGYKYVYHSHKDIENATSDFSISVTQLISEYATNETEANTKYLDKVISVSGKVKEVTTEATGAITIFLDSGDPLAAVTCSFYDDEAASVKGLKPGEEVSIKGKCTGKLMDVVLNKCSIEK